MVARIVSIQVGLPRLIARADGSEACSTGIFKEPVAGPVFLDYENLQGDGQADLRVHGGPDRVLLMFSQSNYPLWEQRLGRKLEPGAFGENATVVGVDEHSACIGDVWQNHNLALQISQPRLPCFKLSERLGLPGVHLEVTASMAAGWYFRALQTGMIQSGDTLELADRPHPEWTISRAFKEFMYGDRKIETLKELQGLPSLSQLWRDRLEATIRKAENP